MDYYDDSFRYFQYRKILRMAGGERSDRKSHPILTTLVILLWFLNFFVYNVSYTNSSLTFNFYNWSGSGAKDTSEVWIASAVFVVTFFMTMTAVVWKKRMLLWYCFGYMLIAFISSFIVRNVSSGWKSRKIMLIVDVVCSFILSVIVLSYVWSFVFIPALVKYLYAHTTSERAHMRSKFIFPYFELVLMLFYVVLVLPLWLPLLLLLTLLFFLSAVGLPIDPLFSIAEPCKLSMDYWSFTQCSYKVHYSHSPNYFMKLLTCNKAKVALLVNVGSDTYHFEYCGERDENGRPQGYGEWRDSDPNGEIYRGYWVDGIPAGPGKSREGNGGGVFAMVRVGFRCCVTGHVDRNLMRPEWRTCSDQVESHPNFQTCDVGSRTEGLDIRVSSLTSSGDPQDKDGGEEIIRIRSTDMASSREVELGSNGSSDMSFVSTVCGMDGIASVDCCISGTFYKGFPYVSYFSGKATFDEVFEVMHPGHIPFALPPKLPFSLHKGASKGLGAVFRDDEEKTPHSAGVGEKEGTETKFDGESVIKREGWDKADESDEEAGANNRPGSMHCGVRTLSGRTISGEIRNSTLHNSALHVHGFISTAAVNEALIFIPGFNSCLNTCIGVYAQFCTLAALPLHISPWIFQWPGGSMFSYYESKAAAESIEFRQQLDSLIRNLYLQGIQRVNFMCHSMGARGFMSFIETATSLRPLSPSSSQTHPSEPIQHSLPPSHGRPLSAASPSELEMMNTSPLGPSPACDQTRVLHSDGSLRGPVVGNVILINPEADLDRFVQIAYPCIREYTEYTTIYADKHDVAIVSAEKANNLQRDSRNMPCRHMAQDQSARDSRHHMGSVNVPRMNLGRILEAGPLLYLDTMFAPDIIDATNIHGNEKALRHSYFSLSREVIEDMRELLVFRKKAEQRSARLVRREGNNVFDFLVAPSFVKN